MTPLFVSEAAAVFEPIAEAAFVNNALSASMIFAASLLGVAVVALLSGAVRRKRRREGSRQ